MRTSKNIPFVNERHITTRWTGAAGARWLRQKEKGKRKKISRRPVNSDVVRHILRVIIALVSSLVLTGSCFGQAVNDARKVDVVESVFHFQMAQCYRYLSPETYFVSYEGSDPDDGLLARLASFGKRVMKRSQLRHFKNTETGRFSIIVSVSNVDFRSQRIAYVSGGCTAAPLDSSDYVYRVEFRWGRWIVMRRKLVGQS